MYYCNQDGKKAKSELTAVVHYAPYDDEPDTVCELFLHVVDQMILPPTFEPECGTFFNDDTQSEGSGNDSVRELGTSSKKSRKSIDDNEADELANFFDCHEDEKKDECNNKDDGVQENMFECHSDDSESDFDDSDDDDEDDSDTETEEEEELGTEEIMNWTKNGEGRHERATYDGPIDCDALEQYKEMDLLTILFFPKDLTPLNDFFLLFLSVILTRLQYGLN